MTAVLSPTSVPARRAASPHRPRLTVRPAPHREPPFDDELSEPVVVGRYDQRLPFAATPLPATDPLPGRPHGLPEPRTWARRLLVGLVESADGRRPLHQLATLLSPSVGRGLGADFERAAAAGTGHWLQHGNVRTVHGGEPADGVAELCATVEVGDRLRAVALRLEIHHGRWQCTRLQLG